MLETGLIKKRWCKPLQLLQRAGWGERLFLLPSSATAAALLVSLMEWWSYLGALLGESAVRFEHKIL
jgi:hypothetical protein